MDKNTKKFGTAKIISIVFCILMLIALVGLMAAKIYTGGQIKTVNNVYAAVTHDIYKDYQGCFATGADYLSENEFNTLRSEYEQKWGEDFHLQTKFQSREKLESGKYLITVKTTVYNDIDSSSEVCGFVLTRQNGKWVISE